MTDLISRLRALSRHEHDDLTIGDEAADELERLTQVINKVNDQAEHFEREWYLRGDEIERLIYAHTKLNPNQADDRELLEYIVNAVRAVERAHGIGDSHE